MRKLYIKIYTAVIKIGIDKIAHFSVSAFLALALCNMGASALIAGIAVMAVGIIKEIIDKDLSGYFDVRDIIADASGIVIALIINLIFV